MKKIVIPLPSSDFDPTETAIPWKILRSNNILVIFATPNAQIASCDQRMLLGTGLRLLSPLLAADQNARSAYKEMISSEEFNNPISWDALNIADYDGIILPGGHAKGMLDYLESGRLAAIVSEFFKMNLPVGAICHGVILASRAKTAEGKSVLHGRKTTALLATQELTAWLLTCLWLKDYYRTYKQTVESEVKSVLSNPDNFIRGPFPLKRDGDGFVVQDGNYLSARWPGDARAFAQAFVKMLA